MSSVVRRDASSLSSTQQITSLNHDFATIEKSVDFATGFARTVIKRSKSFQPVSDKENQKMSVFK